MIGECDRPIIAKGLCSKHYRRMKAHGDPSVVKLPYHEVTVEDRLKGRLTADVNGCQVYTGTKNSSGYGSIKINGKMVGSHRVAWELANGPIADGMCVLHHCDNPPCCNPDHLFLGTRKDNANDRDAKGRLVTPKGEKNGIATVPDLVVADVIRMKGAGSLHRDIQCWLAEQGYSVALPTISTWGRTSRL